MWDRWVISRSDRNGRNRRTCVVFRLNVISETVNTDIMKTTKWRVQHESGTITEISPRDLRGTRLLQECGYEWVNRGDGRGWRQLVFVVTEMEVALAVVGGAQ